MQCIGEVYPTECYQRLCDSANAIILDVRTKPEVQFVGVVDISDTKAQQVFIEWQSYPIMQVNENFLNEMEVALLNLELSKDAEIYCLCRTGVRSLNAANLLSSHGFSKCYNIIVLL